jgi:hypothetical protein
MPPRFWPKTHYFRLGRGIFDRALDRVGYRTRVKIDGRQQALGEVGARILIVEDL